MPEFALFANVENPFNDSARALREAVDTIVHAEALGFEQVWLTEHHFNPFSVSAALLPLLAACTDLRATFEIKGSAHALSLIRVTGMFWEKTAEYSIVAARMPDCMRRHALRLPSSARCWVSRS